MEEEAFRLVIVDDHVVVRAGLRAVFDGDSRLEVVGEAGTAEEGIRRVGMTHPDIVSLDVRLPDRSGVEACREIKARWPDVQVFFLTSYADADALIAAYEAGASGYILKRVDAAGLIDAAVRVGNGEAVFGEVLDAALADRIRSPRGRPTLLDKLSSQERKVLHLIAQGKSNRQIAEAMFLSDKTVKNYVSHVLTKLDMHSRTEAAAYALRYAEKDSIEYPAEDWAND